MPRSYRPDWHINGDGKWETGTGQVRAWVHSTDKCVGRACPVHNPSDHHMRSFPTHYRADRGITERICPHGVGHPDFDDPTIDAVHGCCPGACCMAPGPQRDALVQLLSSPHEDTDRVTEIREVPPSFNPFDINLFRLEIEEFKRRRMGNPRRAHMYKIISQEQCIQAWIEQVADAELYEQRWHEWEDGK